LIAQPLASGSPDYPIRPLCVINPELYAIGIAEIELREISMKVSL